MKKILFLFMVLLVMAGCEKSSYVANFNESPDERMSESVEKVKTTLLSAPNGWVATLPTFAGGGYGFYITFDANQKTTMYADLTDNSSTKLGESTYRIKAGLGAVLIFDTYNYLSILQDPNPATFSGARGSGFSSDVEFTYVRSTPDSIVFIGKQFRQLLKMVKATEGQKTAFSSEAYKTSIDKVKNFFAAIKNPYIEITSGTAILKTGFNLNSTNSLTIGKRGNLTGILEDGTSVGSGTAKFAFTLEGVEFLGNGLVYQGVTFTHMAWKDATTLAIYDSTGKEYIIKSNPVPLSPLSQLFGFPSAFPYKKITIAGTGLPPGVTSGFNAVYNSMLAKFAAGKRSITSTSFILSSNSVFTVEISYMSGTSAFVASAAYTYTKVGDLITLDNTPIGNVNWPTRAAEIKPLADYMLTGPFKIDWVTSTTASSEVLGGLYRTADPTSFIYGVL